MWGGANFWWINHAPLQWEGLSGPNSWIPFYFCVNRLTQNHEIWRGNTHEERVGLLVQQPRGRGPSVPQIIGTLSMPEWFDPELRNLVRFTHVGTKVFLGCQQRLLSKEARPIVPKYCWNPYIWPNGLTDGAW